MLCSFNMKIAFRLIGLLGSLRIVHMDKSESNRFNRQDLFIYMHGKHYTTELVSVFISG